MRRKRKKPIEFSKKILMTVAVSAALVVVFSLVVVWRTGDTSPLGYIIPAIFAELSVATGFYYNKAKAENQIKLKRRYGEDATDPDDIQE